MGYTPIDSHKPKQRSQANALHKLNTTSTQITDVVTTVEREGARAYRGAEIDVERFVYQSDEPVVSDVDDIIGLILDDDTLKIGTLTGSCESAEGDAE